jgi:small GTP-binding protein
MDDSLFIKIIVIGDQSVGKTSLLNQYCYNKFEPIMPATVGCDFTTKVYNNFKGRTIRLQLWDIAGNEQNKIFR